MRELEFAPRLWHPLHPGMKCLRDERSGRDSFTFSRGAGLVGLPIPVVDYEGPMDAVRGALQDSAFPLRGSATLRGGEWLGGPVGT